MIYLLDSSALLPLLWTQHEHHGVVQSWYLDKGSDMELSTCPLVELAFLRLSMQLFKADYHTASSLLKQFKQQPHRHFWGDDFSPDSLHGIVGHQQINDVYLAELAERNAGKLAAVDKTIYHSAVEKIPQP